MACKGARVSVYRRIPRHFNLTTYFLDRNLEEGREQNVALYCDEEAYTYGDVAGLSNRAGHVLRELGVALEDRVLLALSDGLPFVAIWYGAVKIGAVVGEVYTFLQAKDYEYYLNYSRAKVVVVDDTTLPKIREITAHCPYLRCILVVGSAAPLLDGEMGFETLARAAPDELAPADTTKDDIVLWKFTTGSTGAPKAAVHLQHDPYISFEYYAKGVLQMQASDRVLAVPKLFFGYARDLVTLFSFGVGAAGIIFAQRSTPETIFHLVEKFRPTLLVNVPTMMNQMVHHAQADSVDLSSLRLNISSGEALPPELYQKWQDVFGVQTLEGIGSSEAYHIYISNRPGNVKPGSAGQVVPGYQAMLVDGKGQAVPTGEIGELRVAGESTAIMYWNEHEKSKDTFSGDWINTGDIFRCDDEGFYWYQGRVDSMLKVGGIWLSPREVESCLQEHPLVRECAVVEYRRNGLSLPRAYVVLTDQQFAVPDVAEELQQFVKSRLSAHKYPRDVRFVVALPRTATGKVDRRALAKM